MDLYISGIIKEEKMFYIGCHWGREDDGYICSSNWMRNDYKRHKDNFAKRRIIKRIYTNRQDLLETEYRLIQLIKDEELGKKYYNLSKKHFGHWYIDKEKRLTIAEQTSKRCKGVPTGRSWNKGISPSEKTCQILSEKLTEYYKNINEEERNKLKQKRKNMWECEKFKEEQKIKRKELWKNNEKRREEVSSKFKNTFWFTDGIINIRKEVCPEGFYKGQTCSENTKFKLGSIIYIG